MARKKTVLKKAIGTLKSPASRAKSKLRGSRADADRKVLKLARSYEGMPDFANGQPTDAWKARSAAREVRARRMKR